MNRMTLRLQARLKGYLARKKMRKNGRKISKKENGPAESTAIAESHVATTAPVEEQRNPPPPAGEEVGTATVTCEDGSVYTGYS